MNILRSSMVLCLIGLMPNTGGSADQVQNQDKSQDGSESTSYFESGTIPELKLVIDDEGQQKLREAPREYTRCSLVEDQTTTLKSIGVKLKGAAGSYRDFDDRPGLTLNIDKYKKGQRWHGMERLHLNNAVQDESLLSEWLGSELFREAGYPVPRVGHVRLWINDRDLGIYVLREGFDSPFLKRSFQDKNGNLYDGGFVQDIDTALEMDAGDDPDNRSDLVGLATACSQPDPQVRWKEIAARVDIDRFLTFMALERLCGHWDGYTLNMNNYRVYFPPQGKAVFLPHGMDQLFGDPGAGLYDHASPLLAAAVMQNDVWRGQYQARLKSLIPLLRPADRWTARIDEKRERLKPLLESINADQATAHGDRINELKDRLTQRAEALEGLVNDGMPTPDEFDDQGVLHLTDWNAAVEAEEAKLEEVDVAGVASYSITREPFGDYSSSWRRHVLLRKGNYRFEARIQTDSVIPIPDDQGRGAGIRRSSSPRENGQVGTQDWQLVTYELRIPEDQRHVELVLELRARHGSAWFDRDSLRLRRVGE